MDPYRTPAKIPDEKFIQEEYQCSECHVCYEYTKDGFFISIRKGHREMISGIYGSGKERYAYVCKKCGDVWR